MERKLISQGKGGFTIYLPKKWIDRKKLKEGDSIKIEERASSLVIESDIKEKKKIAIELDTESKTEIRHILTHIYRRGFDIIEIKNLDDKTFAKIKKIVKDVLLGFEIIERGKNFCIMENISEPTEEKYEVMLRRIFLIIKETQERIIKDFTSGKFNNMEEIDDFRDQLDKFIIFCRRLIKKEKYSKNPVIDWELLTFLMHINHQQYYLYKYAKDQKIGRNKAAVELLVALQGYFQLFYDAFYKREMNIVMKIFNLKNTYQFGKCYVELAKAKGKETAVLAHIQELFRLVQIGASPILSGILDEKYSME